MPKLSRIWKRHLIKYVTKVEAEWTSWKVKEPASCYETLRQLASPRNQRTNPKMEIVYDTVLREVAPCIKITMVDGHVLDYKDCRDHKAPEMLDEVYEYALDLDRKFEEEGKNIEDSL